MTSTNITNGTTINPLTYDAIVVGARVAGAPTAMLLARRGYHVLLVDRATFPSDTVSTHNLTLAAMASLQRWGLYEEALATGCPPVNRLRFDLNGLVLEGWDGPLEGVNQMVNLRRSVLDDILVRAAKDAGADVREGFSVDELIIENGICRGIRGRDAGGKAVEARATIVIGADGRHSRIAATMGVDEYLYKAPSTFTYYTYFRGLEMDGRMELYDREVTTIVVQPTTDGLTMVAVMQPIAGFREFRADIEANYDRAIALVPELHDRIATATRAERFYGSVDVPNGVRVPYGPGFALVGDAGLHHDPMLGQGITNAFTSVELLVPALDRGLRGDVPMDEALREYHEARDAAILPMFDLICGFISYEPMPPEVEAAFGALPGNQRQIDRFVGVSLGTVRVEDFFSPESLASIVEEAQRKPVLV
jgi:flavin-dependent dehydrogenase